MAKDTAFAMKSEPVEQVTPIQATATQKVEQQLSVWIPKDLMKRLKVRGAETNQSLKEMVIEALERFL